MQSWENYLAIAREAAHLAGDFLVERYGGGIKERQCKEDGHYSIDEDIECNKLYVDFFRRKTPETDLYTEEGEQNLGSDLVWTVDPIDGSTNYRIGLPIFVTQICLLYKKEPVVAVVYSPVLEYEYAAIRGGGAFLNGKRIDVSQLTEFRKALLVLDKGHAKASDVGNLLRLFGNDVHTARVWGSVGFELAAFAAGKIDILIGLNMSAFDYAPGVLLIREAGGVVKNLEGEEWKIEDKNLVASNEYLMPKVLEIISKYQINYR